MEIWKFNNVIHAMNDLFSDTVNFCGKKDELNLSKRIQVFQDKLDNFNYYCESKNISSSKFFATIPYLLMWSNISKAMLFINNNQMENALFFIDKNMESKNKISFPYVVSSIFHLVLDFRKNGATKHEDIEIYTNKYKEITEKIKVSDLNPFLKNICSDYLDYEMSYIYDCFRFEKERDLLLNKIANYELGTHMNAETLTRKEPFFKNLYQDNYLDFTKTVLPQKRSISFNEKSFKVDKNIENHR